MSLVDLPPRLWDGHRDHREEMGSRPVVSYVSRFDHPRSPVPGSCRGQGPECSSSFPCAAPMLLGRLRLRLEEAPRTVGVAMKHAVHHPELRHMLGKGAASDSVSPLGPAAVLEGDAALSEKLSKLLGRSDVVLVRFHEQAAARHWNEEISAVRMDGGC